MAKSKYMVVQIPQKGSRRKRKAMGFGKTKMPKLMTAAQARKSKITIVVFKKNKSGRFRKSKVVNKKR
jgi:hypothetical protein